MGEVPSGGSAGTARSEERRQTIRTERNATLPEPSGCGDGANREGRSAFGQFDLNGAKQRAPQGDRSRANRDIPGIFGTVEWSETAKLGAVFGQHERSEPPKPESAA